MRTTGAARPKTVGTRAIGATILGTARPTFPSAAPFATRTLATFTVAHTPLPSFPRFAAFFVIELAIAVSVELLEHPLAHLSPLGTAFPRRRGGLVACLCRGGARQHGGQ